MWLEENDNLENNIDWVASGKVSTPIYQGAKCQSCWVFAASAVLEGSHAIKSGNLVGFSQQQVVDCQGTGCGKGTEGRAWNYWKSNYIMKGGDYPYTRTAGTCQYSQSKATNIKCATNASVAADSMNQLKTAVSRQPVAAHVDSSSNAWNTYKTGILNTSTCGTTLDHGVTIVGYGSNYWLVKNSMGPTWGDKGYIKVAMVDGIGMCGIQHTPSYA